jgi:hypothetical protein
MTADFQLGPMPGGRLVRTVDEATFSVPVGVIFQIAAEVEKWPAHLMHYRFVRFRERASDGGGIVEMSANRPFGALDWPTWWVSQMAVDHVRPAIRFRHIEGITSGMDVEWSFEPLSSRTTHVRIVHVWDGPRWPIVGAFAASRVIGPIFVHGIASRTLAGLGAAAEQSHLSASGASGEART